MAGIQGLPPSSYPTPAPLNVPAAAEQMQQQINTFSQALQELLKQPSLSQDSTFLGKMKGAILALAETSKQINGE
jgi:hypothetical protein